MYAKGYSEHVYQMMTQHTLSSSIPRVACIRIELAEGRCAGVVIANAQHMRSTNRRSLAPGSLTDILL